MLLINEKKPQVYGHKFQSYIYFVLVNQAQENV